MEDIGGKDFARACNCLLYTSHEQFIIKSIYFEGMKQVELAKILGISKVRMSQKLSLIHIFSRYIKRSPIY